MGRYLCAKGKKVTIKKANEYCILARCPELKVHRPIIVKGRLKFVDVQVVSETMTELVGCK